MRPTRPAGSWRPVHPTSTRATRDAQFPTRPQDHDARRAEEVQLVAAKKARSFSRTACCGSPSPDLPFFAPNTAKYLGQAKITCAQMTLIFAQVARRFAQMTPICAQVRADDPNVRADLAQTTLDAPSSFVVPPLYDSTGWITRRRRSPICAAAPAVFQWLNRIPRNQVERSQGDDHDGI